jgi:hypothetical protein
MHAMPNSQFQYIVDRASIMGYTKSHEANFPHINHSNDNSNCKGGKRLNNTERKRQRRLVRMSGYKQHARSKSDASQPHDFLWGIAQVRYDGTRLSKH